MNTNAKSYGLGITLMKKLARKRRYNFVPIFYPPHPQPETIRNYLFEVANGNLCEDLTTEMAKVLNDYELFVPCPP